MHRSSVELNKSICSTGYTPITYGFVQIYHRMLRKIQKRNPSMGGRHKKTKHKTLRFNLEYRDSKT